MHPQTGQIYDKEEILEEIRKLEEELKAANTNLPPDLDPVVQAKIEELKGKLKEAEELVDIPPKDFMKVVNMNRKQRRTWAAKQRKKTRRLSKRR